MRSQNIFLKKRIKGLQKELRALDCTVCVIENPTDLYYLTNTKLSSGRLYVDKKGGCLFVDGRYEELAKKSSPLPVVLQSKSAELDYLDKVRAKKIAFDSHTTSYLDYEKFASFLKKGVKLKPSPRILSELRAVKDSEELKLIRKSAKLNLLGLNHIRRILKPGITEKEVAKEYELFCLKHGAEKLAFKPIIAFGKNSSMPHYRAGNARLKANDIALVDIGVVVDSYYSDMTRTLFIGKANPTLDHMAKVVKRAHAAALALCRPGTRVGELDAAARKVMAKEKLEHLFIHSLGHGVGLEIHEFPRLKAKGEDAKVVLKKGMVITIEPGLYLPHKGGIRHEDTIVITNKGYENLYSGLKGV